MTLHVDNTILSAVNTCDMKAGLRHVLGLTTAEDRLELTAGQACHEALAAWHKGQPAAVALHEFEVIYKVPGTRVSVEDRLSYTNVRRTLTRFFKNYEQNPLPYTPQRNLVEVTFEAPLDDNGDFRMIGRIDAIVAYFNRLVVLENKTTGAVNDFWKRKWPMSSQLTTYVFGATNGLVDGKPLGLPIEEALILGLELRKLPQSHTKCKEHALPYSECGDLHAKWEFSGPHPRPQGFIQRWRADALSAAKRFAWMKENITSIQDCSDKLEQQGQFNGACSYCEFNKSCQQGLPVHLMQANLLHKPWDPRDVNHSGLIQIDMKLPQAATHAPSIMGVTTLQAPLPSNVRKV